MWSVTVGDTVLDNHAYGPDAVVRVNVCPSIENAVARR